MSAILRAKMRVSSVTHHIGGDGKVEQEVINLNAVYDSNPESENHQWSKWTPSGTLSLTITNPDAIGKVNPGQQYFIDIVPAG